MQITIAAVGKGKDGPEQAIASTYLKRIPWKITIKEVEEKRPLDGAKRMESEAKLLHDSIPGQAVKIVLDEGGKTLSSQAFADKLQHWQDDGHKQLAFLIGGADGHTKETIQGADLVLSLGAMTWPHMLVRTMLAEQLYRAHTILTGHPYHRE